MDSAGRRDDTQQKSKDLLRKRKFAGFDLEVSLIHPTRTLYSHFNVPKLLSEKYKDHGASAPLVDVSDASDLDELEESEDRKRIRDLVRKLEQKYGSDSRSQKKKRNKEHLSMAHVDDFMDMGMGYDKSDNFIDDSEAYDELLPSTLTTKYGGYYVNHGKLEFRERSPSDEDSDTESASLTGENQDGLATHKAGDVLQATKARRLRVESSSSESELEDNMEQSGSSKDQSTPPKTSVGEDAALMNGHAELAIPCSKRPTTETGFQNGAGVSLKKRKLDNKPEDASNDLRLDQLISEVVVSSSEKGSGPSGGKRSVTPDVSLLESIITGETPDAVWCNDRASPEEEAEPLDSLAKKLKSRPEKACSSQNGSASQTKPNNASLKGCPPATKSSGGSKLTRIDGSVNTVALPSHLPDSVRETIDTLVAISSQLHEKSRIFQQKEPCHLLWSIHIKCQAVPLRPIEYGAVIRYLAEKLNIGAKTVRKHVKRLSTPGSLPDLSPGKSLESIISNAKSITSAAANVSKPKDSCRDKLTDGSSHSKDSTAGVSKADKGSKNRGKPEQMQRMVGKSATTTSSLEIPAGCSHVVHKAPDKMSAKASNAPTRLSNPSAEEGRKDSSKQAPPKIAPVSAVNGTGNLLKAAKPGTSGSLSDGSSNQKTVVTASGSAVSTSNAPVVAQADTMAHGGKAQQVSVKLGAKKVDQRPGSRKNVGISVVEASKSGTVPEKSVTSARPSSKPISTNCPAQKAVLRTESESSSDVEFIGIIKLSPAECSPQKPDFSPRLKGMPPSLAHVQKMQAKRDKVRAAPGPVNNDHSEKSSFAATLPNCGTGRHVPQDRPHVLPGGTGFGPAPIPGHSPGVSAGPSNLCSSRVTLDNSPALSSRYQTNGGVDPMEFQRQFLAAIRNNLVEGLTPCDSGPVMGMGLKLPITSAADESGVVDGFNLDRHAGGNMQQGIYPRDNPMSRSQLFKANQR